MKKSDPEAKLIALKNLFDEAIELLNEVKPYRSIFYKQKVAELQSKLNKLSIEK
jgi:hypothetical protein